MTDNRPEPKYGQYAPIPPVLPGAVPAVVAAAPEQPTVRVVQSRRTWDTAMTTLFLVLGVADVVTGFSTFANLADGLRAAYAAQGYPAFTSETLATTMGLALNIARVTILGFTILAALLRIRAGKIAIWVPVAGAVLAGIVVIVGLLVVIMQDPALAEYVQRTTTP
jgi:hypothetical protein